MAPILKPLNQQVMVITGASSGIGLATARAAAEQGARLVLNARSWETLNQIVDEITNRDGQAVQVPGDVSVEADVDRLASTAIERFGSFDTWVNNAGVSIFRKLDEVRPEEHRRMFDINFWGIVNGSLVAARHLRSHGGAIINLGSVASDVALPLQGMYSASKHAVRGFTDALRMELEEEGAPISVTLIKPTSINTPFPHNARNYLDKEPKLPDPVYEPEEVAAAILSAAVTPARDIYVGGAGRALSAVGETFPRAFDWVGEKVMGPQQYSDEPPRDPRGTLYRGGEQGVVHGDHPRMVRQRSYYTRAVVHPVLTSTALAAAAVGAVGLLLRRR